MFQVKICGTFSTDDLKVAIAAGADAIGLNFHSGSKRFVSMTAAEAISFAAAGKVFRVGLFVNAPVEFIRNISAIIPLDAIQAHGVEDASWFAEANELKKPLIRAIRCPQTAANLQAEIDRVPPDQNLYDALLIDGSAVGSTESGLVYGGSGAIANWKLIREIRDSIKLPFILAGGLTPGNVAAAIQAVSPDGVDVASGVEDDYGGKDADKVAAFVSTAKTSLNTASR